MTLLALSQTNKILLTSLVLLLSVSVSASNASATTYYVDFKDGDDSLAGTSEATAWKHAPGDINAEGVPAQIGQDNNIPPGTIIKFRGGVTYKGGICWGSRSSRCNYNANSPLVSGESGNPIILSGDSWPGLEGTRAIFDGSEPITGWTQCTVAICGDHPNRDKLYYTTNLPAGINTLSSGLFYQDDELLWLTHEPDQPDPYYVDNAANFYTGAQITGITITDNAPDRPIALYGQSLVDWGAYVLVWVEPNVISYREIKSCDPSTNTITFDSAGVIETPFRYSIINHPRLIDEQGEYYSDGSIAIVWPHDDVDLSTTGEVTTPVLKKGVYTFNINYITVEGFKIQKYDYQVLLANLYGTGIIFRNNEVAKSRTADLSSYSWIYVSGGNDILIENNYVHHNIGSRGILAGNAKIINNTIEKVGSSAIAAGSNTEVINNTILGQGGTHINGIRTYGDSPSVTIKNILIAGNKIFDTPRPYTLQNAEDIIVYNNIFVAGAGTPAVAVWSGTARNIRFINNVLLSDRADGITIYSAGKVTSGLVVKNNILSKPVSEGDHTHNIYTFYDSSYTPNEGEIYEPDLNNIFVDPDNNDFRLKPGSPAIDNGTDVTAYLPIGQFDYDFGADKDGNPRPSGAVGGLYTKRVHTQINIQAFEIPVFWVVIIAASAGLILITLTAAVLRKVKRPLL